MVCLIVFNLFSAAVIGKLSWHHIVIAYFRVFRVESIASFHSANWLNIDNRLFCCQRNINHMHIHLNNMRIQPPFIWFVALPTARVHVNKSHAYLDYFQSIRARLRHPSNCTNCTLISLVSSLHQIRFSNIISLQLAMRVLGRDRHLFAFFHTRAHPRTNAPTPNSLRWNDRGRPLSDYSKSECIWCLCACACALARGQFKVNRWAMILFNIVHYIGTFVYFHG